MILIKRAVSVFILLSLVFLFSTAMAVSATAANSEKTLTVDIHASEEEGNTYQTIAAAIDYINRVIGGVKTGPFSSKPDNTTALTFLPDWTG
ncbi:MAG: hypothetical protein LUE63_01470 [Lachnospiraceae bacterium]|nr:hypothetical protein [Lachnospiraceae bacterium]